MAPAVEVYCSTAINPGATMRQTQLTAFTRGQIVSQSLLFVSLLTAYQGNLLWAQPAAAQIGICENHADVGTVLHPGSADYDSAKNTYTITGSAISDCQFPIFMSDQSPCLSNRQSVIGNRQ